MAIDASLCVLQERLPDGSVRRSYGRWVQITSAIQAQHGLPAKPVLGCR